MKRFLIATDGDHKKRANTTAQNGSSFISCPICAKDVPMSFINTHIDNNCDKKSADERQITPLRTKSHDINDPNTLSLKDNSSGIKDKPPGLFIFEDFISEREEQELIEYLDYTEGDINPWVHSNFNGPSSAKKWGIRTNLRTREFLPAIHELPSVLLTLVSRMQEISSLNMTSFQPNEANAISYEKRKGHYLGSHCDDRKLSGTILVNLSLQGDAVMRYTRDKRAKSKYAETYDVLLKRRSLQIQTGVVRYDYQHGIPNDKLLSDRRVSITFRQNASKN